MVKIDCEFHLNPPPPSAECTKPAGSQTSTGVKWWVVLPDPSWGHCCGHLYYLTVTTCVQMHIFDHWGGRGGGGGGVSRNNDRCITFS